MQSASPYNIIFGRSAMRKFGAIISILHGIVRFRTKGGFGMIHSKPPMGPIAMVESKARTAKSDTLQANNKFDEIKINSKYEDQGVRIRVGLP